MPEVTAFMNAVPKTVVTSSGPVTPWEGTRVTEGSDLDAEIARLRAESPGGIANFGSSGLTVTLLERGWSLRLGSTWTWVTILARSTPGGRTVCRPSAGAVSPPADGRDRQAAIDFT
ncbi:hypothetical protein ACQEU8_20600 [Streptomyces sp. CA-250714]|uniref:hypothetical protein n=1 Tax=Streptomyces sp. CA-250714 TaxID=3240060 RepID=UPI003D906FB4